ncbi:interstitial collagenase-like [Cervus canadensis]|uniref:interstitial collagenase-like n=1 Tax=Cervus canadensis TaxID=1574408 RepID=UPI001C9E600C|nr:interstitial collagenase-like [Cervus canadensis]
MPRLPLLLLLLGCLGSHGFPATSETQEQDMEMVQKYLQNYYSLEVGTSRFERQRNHGSMIEKLKQMQEFFGLKVTGKIDADTLDIVRKPRCGVPDVSSPYELTPGNPRWLSTHLTYRVENYTPDMSRADVEQAVRKAFQLWSSASPLTFTKVSEGQADIMISFVWRDHRDNSPFDGPGGVLAHAFQPGIGIGGDVHLDEEETWTKDLNGYNLYWVLAHELGHSFGLSHSTNMGALMYPNYIYTGEVYLSQDDIKGIQAIYGPPNKLQLVPVLPTPQPCDNWITFDAVTKIRGELFFFKDRFIIRVHPYYPGVEVVLISAFWPDLSSGIEAAYDVPKKDEALFFKGNKYWVARGGVILRSYPRDIYSSFGFPRWVRNVDAAVHEEETGKTYFFVDNEYWRYDENRESMDAGYPREIAEDFPGISGKVDAVFEHEGNFYFFQGSTQYKFDPKTERILAFLDANSWFNC